MDNVKLYWYKLTWIMNKQIHYAQGVVVGTDYASAVEELENNYGDEDIVSIDTIYAIDSLCFDEEDWKEEVDRK